MAGPARGATLQVAGYEELLRAFTLADTASRKALRDTLRQAGEHVRVDAARRLAPVSQKSAAGYRVAVRQRGLVVRQSLRRTTGLHPEWGGYQMRRALLPAVNENEPATTRAVERALDQIANRFNAGAVV